MRRLPAADSRASGFEPRYGWKSEGGHRKLGPRSLGLRPKSITPMCASTSGAGKGDAIIPRTKVISYFERIFSRHKAVLWSGGRGNTACPAKPAIKKRISREDQRMRRLMRPALMLLLVAVVTLPAIADKAKDFYSKGQDAEARQNYEGAYGFFKQAY